MRPSFSIRILTSDGDLCACARPSSAAPIRCRNGRAACCRTSRIPRLRPRRLCRLASTALAPLFLRRGGDRFLDRLFCDSLASSPFLLCRGGLRDFFFFVVSSFPLLCFFLFGLASVSAMLWRRFFFRRRRASVSVWALASVSELVSVSAFGVGVGVARWRRGWRRRGCRRRGGNLDFALCRGQDWLFVFGSSLRLAFGFRRCVPAALLRRRVRRRRARRSARSASRRRRLPSRRCPSACASSVRDSSAEQPEQEHDVDQPDDRDVAPETRVARHRYFGSALVAMPTLVISARCNASIRLTNFCTGSSRSGRITTATFGFACFNSASRAVSVVRFDQLVIQPDASVRSIEMVWTAAGLTGALVAPLDGMTRFMLFSSSGVVIMKMISRTKARSSSGVMLISESVDRRVALE